MLHPHPPCIIGSDKFCTSDLRYDVGLSVELCGRARHHWTGPLYSPLQSFPCSLTIPRSHLFTPVNTFTSTFGSYCMCSSGLAFCAAFSFPRCTALHFLTALLQSTLFQNCSFPLLMCDPRLKHQFSGRFCALLTICSILCFPYETEI